MDSQCGAQGQGLISEWLGMYDAYILLDDMNELSCHFEMYVNIMLKINKMIQYGCVKRTIGDMMTPQGKSKGGLWETKSYVAKSQPQNSSKILPCPLNEPISFS